MREEYTTECGTFHTCKTCEKKFYIPSWQRENYHWKHNNMFFCSYSCLRVYEKQHKKYTHIMGTRRLKKNEV